MTLFIATHNVSIFGLVVNDGAEYGLDPPFILGKIKPIQWPALAALAALRALVPILFDLVCLVATTRLSEWLRNLI